MPRSRTRRAVKGAPGPGRDRLRRSASSAAGREPRTPSRTKSSRGKVEHAGPAGRLDLVLAATELPRPAPEQRPVAVGHQLRRIERGPVVEHAARTTAAKRRPPAMPDQIADQVAHAGQLVVAVDPAPERDQQHPAAVDPGQVRALPDVRWGHLGGDRVVVGEQRIELDPGVEVVAAVEQDLRPARPGCRRPGPRSACPRSRRRRDRGPRRCRADPGSPRRASRPESHSISDRSLRARVTPAFQAWSGLPV